MYTAARCVGRDGISSLAALCHAEVAEFGLLFIVGRVSDLVASGLHRPNASVCALLLTKTSTYDSCRGPVVVLCLSARSCGGRAQHCYLWPWLHGLRAPAAS